MRCDEARECCHLRADGELPTARAAELESHLSACLECRMFARQMECLIGGLDELRRTSMNVAEIVHTAPVRWRARWKRAALAMAAAILLTVSAGLLRRERQHPTVVSPPAADSAQNSDERFEANIELTGPSARQYLVLAQKTSQANVHVVCLLPVVSADERDGSNGARPADPAGM
jgi:anti-sigma factor RsiW